MYYTTRYVWSISGYIIDIRTASGFIIDTCISMNVDVYRLRTPHIPDKPSCAFLLWRNRVLTIQTNTVQHITVHMVNITYCSCSLGYEPPSSTRTAGKVVNGCLGKHPSLESLNDRINASLFRNLTCLCTTNNNISYLENVYALLLKIL